MLRSEWQRAAESQLVLHISAPPKVGCQENASRLLGQVALACGHDRRLRAHYHAGQKESAARFQTSPTTDVVGRLGAING